MKLPNFDRMPTSSGEGAVQTRRRRAVGSRLVAIGAALAVLTLAGCDDMGKLTHIRTSKERGVTITAEFYDTERRVVRVSYGSLKDADLETLKEAAEEGNAEAFMALGTLYWFGGGLEVRGKPVFARDKAKAVDYYKRAADSGYVPAQAFLAHALATGDGVKPDPAAAAPWLKQSAAKGDVKSQLLLAEFLENAKGGLAKDVAKAAELYRKAAEAGLPRAQCRLARLYTAGEGVAQDYAASIKWYQKCAAGGDVAAMTALAEAYEQGQGVEPDPEAAAEWFQKAAEKGVVPAMLRMAKFHETGTGVARDRAKAAKWYIKVAEAGDSRAYRAVAEAYDRGYGVEKNPEAAAKFMIMALKAQDPLAREQMSTGAYGWTKDFRSELQRRLRKEGVYRGRIDGILGKTARQSIEKLLE